MKISYDKLVRDNIPKIIKSSGKTPEYVVMNDEMYSKKLAEKLCEEAAEFRESGSNEELADILEVFYAILKNKGIEIGEIEEIRKEKALTNGAFDKKYLLKGVIS